MNSQITQLYTNFFEAFIQFLVGLQQIYLPQPPVQNLINFNDIDIEQQETQQTFQTNQQTFYQDQQTFQTNQQLTNQFINGYIHIQDFLKDSDLDRQKVFLLSNEIDKVDMKHHYQHGLNKGNCWNCFNEYSHTCCAACKRIESQCDCVYICGYTRPTGQMTKRGKFNQFTKCKYYTNNINHVDHECIGMFTSENITLFINERDVKNFNIIIDVDKRKKNCYRCNQEGHFSNECKDFTCYKCKEKGHLARDCFIDYNYSTGWD
jgi:hypothetical protein